VVRVDPPFCWARANNQALRLAQHPWVLLLHDDCYFTRPGDLERLLRRLEICGHLVAVAPAGIGFPERGQQSNLRRGEGLRSTRFALSGACLLLRTEAFVATGPFDEGYVDYGCHDLDWFYRARAQGYRWAIDADVRVEHEVAATYGDRDETVLCRSNARFREQHGTQPLDGLHWERPRLRLSWVIASRNGAGHLARCLGSIEASRSLFPEDMEVLLVLDGSTDSSAEVALAFNASLPVPLPLRLVRFPEPAGSAAKAKNRALRLARGEIQLPMDDDDAALPARAQLIPALESGSDVAVGDFWIVEQNGEVAVRQVAPITFERLSQPYAQNWGPWSTAVRAEIWEQYGLFREDLPCDEDLDLWLRWLRDGVRFKHVPEPVHLYLIRPNSVVSRHNSVEIGERIRAAYRDGQGALRMGLQGL
jgi:GT2 family glycosyltransferase